MNLSLAEAVAVVARGGCLVYPTETLYALGADARNGEAVRRVFQAKSRDEAKPLPLILGSMEQLSLVTAFCDADLERLARAFWPGPLSVLVPALDSLSVLARDRRGLTSVRVTPHPLAAKPSLACGCPLVATSANVSGHPAVAAPGALDPRLLERTDGVLADKPWPAGGAPSTVVGLEGGGRLRVYREGALALERLVSAGFQLEARGESVQNI